jgi:hypothetical protein
MKDVEVMGIIELRRNLGRRIDAAFFFKEPTVIQNEKKNERRAALVPFEWLEELYAYRARDAAAKSGEG